MSDAHETLTAEYGRLLEGFASGEAGLGEIQWAILHILRRLGPPSLTEASEVERREAIASEGDGER